MSRSQSYSGNSEREIGRTLRCQNRHGAGHGQPGPGSGHVSAQPVCPRTAPVLGSRDFTVYLLLSALSFVSQFLVL